MKVKYYISLLLLDFCCFLAASFSMIQLRFQSVVNIDIDPKFIFPYLILFSVYILFGCYSLENFKQRRNEIYKIHFAQLLSFFILALFIFFFRLDISGSLGRGYLLGTLSLFFILNTIARLIFYSILTTFLRKRSILILTEAQNKQLISDEILKQIKYFTFSIASISELKNYNLSKQWLIVISSNLQLNDHLIKDFSHKRQNGVQFIDITRFYELFLNKLPVSFLEKNWIVMSGGFDLLSNPAALKFKRIIDILLATSLLLITFPLIIVCAALIKIESKGNPFYKQTRTGEFGKTFTIYKLRTMKINSESSGAQWARKNDPRVTFLGRFLRRSRIDELPQLWNVLKGEMSFIGPRPERPEFDKALEKEIPFYSLRTLLKPGITGWAQVMYPYGASTEDSKKKLEYDLYYIKNYSILIDINIIFKTFLVVLGAKGR